MQPRAGQHPAPFDTGAARSRRSPWPGRGGEAGGDTPPLPLSPARSRSGGVAGLLCVCVSPCLCTHAYVHGSVCVCVRASVSAHACAWSAGTRGPTAGRGERHLGKTFQKHACRFQLALTVRSRRSSCRSGGARVSGGVPAGSPRHTSATLRGVRHPPRATAPPALPTTVGNEIGKLYPILIQEYR